MTPDAFHALVLQLAAVRAKPVLDTIQFQVAARTFATLGWPAVGWAVIKLSDGEGRSSCGGSRLRLAPGQRSAKRRRSCQAGHGAQRLDLRRMSGRAARS